MILNTTLLNGYGAAAADHVLCQEVGHIEGLDHNRDGKRGGSPDDTCMNDGNHLGEYTTPNSHDTAQLASIYKHDDNAGKGGNGGKGGGGGPNCEKNPSHPKCQNQVKRVTVHVFPVPD